MNQISCIFLSDDIFIINILDDYKSITDKKLGHIILTCIGFNSSIKEKNYKGIIMVKNFDTFSSEYIVVKCNFANDSTPNVNSLIEGVEGISIEDRNFIDILTPILKNLIIEKTIYNNVSCFNSSFSGEVYNYSLDKRVGIDFDILVHNYLSIVNEGKKMIDNIEFNF
jgi:hypothetical protein